MSALGRLWEKITGALGSGDALHSPHRHGHHGHHGHHAHDGHHGPGHGHRFDDPEALSAVLDDPARDAWQRPDEVLRALALGPAMRVADVGAGTGYFAVRLARAVPAGDVTAIDVEPGMVRFV
ncbi:MAG: methyltransferase domain-containing protein, partial [Myxococcota bacterium]